MLAGPDLVDACKGPVIDRGVAPADAGFAERVVQARAEQAVDAVAGRGVEVAAEDEGRCIRRLRDLLHDRPDLLEPRAPVGGLLPPTGGRPEVDAHRRRQKTETG